MPHVRVPEIVYAIETVPPPLERAWTEQPGSNGDEWSCVDIVTGLDADGFVSKNALAAQAVSANISSTSLAVPPSGSPISLRYYQKEAVESTFNRWGEGKNAPVIILPTGCHRAGQRVIMFDGTTKPVEDVRVGDKLLGPDSAPRTVLALCRGTGPMVEVVPIKGESWICNDEHVLSLTLTPTNSASSVRFPSDRCVSTVENISLGDYAKRSKTFKHIAKLYRSEAVTFSHHETRALPIDPYFLGLYLGDGSMNGSNSVGISKPDPEVLQVCEEQARVWGVQIKTDWRVTDTGSCPTHRFTVGNAGGGPKRNRLLDALRSLGLMNIPSETRFIPDAYKRSTIVERQAVLAGLLDSDGARSRGGYDFISKSERLARDLAFLVRSIGQAAYITRCSKGCQNGFVGEYWRVSLSGDFSELPMRIPRKRAPNRLQKKSVLRTGFELRPTNTTEPFFGFTLDGDHLYLLEDFTVTHNSGKTLVAAEIMRCAHESGQMKRPVFLAHRQELLEQTMAKVRIMAPKCTVGLVQAEHNSPQHDFVVASVQTLAGKSGDRIKQILDHGAPSLLIIDEAHHSTSPSFQRVITAFREANPELRIMGLTATPGRADGTSLDRVFDCVAYQKSIYEMINEGFLVPPVGERVVLDINLDVVDSESGDFVTKKLAKVVDKPEVNAEIVKQWLLRAQDRKTIAFCITKQHAQNIADEFTKANVPAAIINESTKSAQRKQLFQKFREGHIKVLCSVEVLTEGFDEPSVECVLMARPTQSQALLIQAVGRGLRLYPGKQDCFVLDCTGNSSKYALAQLANLTGLEPPRPPGEGPPKPPTEEEEEISRATVEGVFAHKLDFKLRKRESKYVWREIPACGWALQIPKIGYFLVAWHGGDKSLATVRFHDLRDGKRDTKPLVITPNPLDFEMAYGLVEAEVQRLLEAKSSRARLKDPLAKDAAPEPFAFLEDGLEDDLYISEVTLKNDAEWRTKLITPKQRDFLAAKGVKPNKMPETNGEASDLITIMMVENDMKWREPATSGQLYYLRMNNVPYEKDITKNAAKKLILGHKMGSKS